MKKKTSLPNVDDLSIKYVFDDLDPSEIMLVEQAMSKDQNRLIEVHSMKSTWKRVQKNLPEMHPPAELTENILENAQQYSSKHTTFFTSRLNPGLFATAAVVIFSLIVTFAYLIPSNSDATEGLATGGEGTVALENIANNEMQPWIDRENMMYIGALEIHNKVLLPDSLRKNAIKTSGTATPATRIPPMMQDFQLTGTRY
ncbi:hypothetical protein QLX67_03620 [Balneolaceae bacterium ANBcel3]|nr:hypothetical protein [Balneolaceae bacterium ANBcel3]